MDLGRQEPGRCSSSQAGMLKLGSAGPVSSSVQVSQIIPSSHLSKDGGHTYLKYLRCLYFESETVPSHL